jgi:hypothetical protein
MSAHLEHRHPIQDMATIVDRPMLLRHESRENAKEIEATQPLTAHLLLVPGIPIFVLRLRALLIRAILLPPAIMLLQLCHLLLDLRHLSHPSLHTAGLHR